MEECDRDGVKGEIKKKKRCGRDKYREQEGVCIVMGDERVELCWTGAALYTVSGLTKAMSDGRQPLQRSHGPQ